MQSATRRIRRFPVPLGIVAAAALQMVREPGRRSRMWIHAAPGVNSDPWSASRLALAMIENADETNLEVAQ